MRLSVTYLREGERWTQVAGPEVPIHKQLEDFKTELRSGQNKAGELFVFELERRRYKDFGKRGVTLKPAEPIEPAKAPEVFPTVKKTRKAQ